MMGADEAFNVLATLGRPAQVNDRERERREAARRAYFAELAASEQAYRDRELEQTRRVEAERERQAAARVQREAAWGERLRDLEGRLRALTGLAGQADGEANAARSEE